jgi:hypothetical protein
MTRWNAGLDNFDHSFVVSGSRLHLYYPITLISCCEKKFARPFQP